MDLIPEFERMFIDRREFEDLQKDKRRLDFLLEALLGDDGDQMTMRMVGALLLGKSGRDAVDAAMILKEK